MTVKNQTILSFDTALSGITIGLVTSAGLVVARQVETAREQAAWLVPMIQEVMQEGGVGFSELDAIACSIGPGSFTGLRIGLTTAKTLSLAIDKPVIGLNTLDVMAYHYKGSNPMLIVLETKRQDFYACYYDENKNAITGPFAADAQDIIARAPVNDFKIGGDCLERFKNVSGYDGVYEANIDQPKPEVLIKFARNQFGSIKEGQKIEPLYLRGADTSKPKHKPRKLESA